MDYTEEKLSTRVRNEYMADVERLSKYMNWIEKKSGNQVQSYYDGEDDYKLIQIPVYDSTLLAFVKEDEKTKLVDRNYRGSRKNRSFILPIYIYTLHYAEYIFCIEYSEQHMNFKIWSSCLNERSIFYKFMQERW